MPGAIMVVLLSKGMCHFIMFYLATSLGALLCERPLHGAHRGCDPGKLKMEAILSIKKK